MESVPVFVVVGMISLFGAVANAPIAVLIMVVEMVGSITILIPAMAAVAVSTLLKGEKTIFRQQVPTKAQSGAHRGEYDRETLERILVRDAMIPQEAVITLSLSDEPAKVLDLTATTGHSGFPVLADNRLAGIITNRDARTIRTAEGGGPALRQVMTPAPFVVNPEDTLEDAIAIMVGHGINHLPVVAKESPDQLVGFLTRTDILKAYARSSHSASCRKQDQDPWPLKPILSLQDQNRSFRSQYKRGCRIGPRNVLPGKAPDRILVFLLAQYHCVNNFRAKSWHARSRSRSAPDRFHATAYRRSSALYRVVWYSCSSSRETGSGFARSDEYSGPNFR